MFGLSALRGNPEKPPVFVEQRSSPWLIITTVSFAIYTDAFLYGVIVPVLPFAIESRVGIPHDRVQYWISVLLALFGASLLVTSPMWGFLADRWSNRKVPMLLGLFTLAGATAFLCAGQSIAMFIIGRLLQGLSAALVWTLGLALIVDTVDKSNIGKAMGWVSMSLSLAILSSPLLGGVVYNGAGYYPVFAMCFGLIAVDIFMRLAIIEVKDAKKWLGNDLNSPERRPSTQDAQEMEKALDALSPTAETALPQRRLDRWRGKLSVPRVVQLLRSPRLLAALWGTLIHGAMITSFDATLPLFVESTFGWSSVGAALIFLPILVPSLLSPLIGIVCDRYGPKWLATSGFLLATPFLVCLRFVDENTFSDKATLAGVLVGVGVALALPFGPLMAEIMFVVEAEGEARFGVGYANSSGVYAQAYGLYNMAFAGGSLVGPLLGGLIRDSAGWATVGWSLAILSAFTALPTAFWTGGRLFKPSKDDVPSEPA